MSSKSVKTATRLEVVFAEDRMRAWFQLRDPTSVREDEPISAEEVALALKASRIAITEEVKTRVTNFMALVGPDATEQTEPTMDAEVREDGPREIPERFLIAEGRPPVEGRHAEFEWDEQFKDEAHDWNEEASIDYFSLNTILTVPEETFIGRIVPPENGTAGVDVCGRELRPRILQGVALSLGEGLKAAQGEACGVVTQTAGRVVVERDMIRVDQVLILRSDIDFDSGSVDACIDVDVSGTVRSRFSVKTSKSLKVGKAIEAAFVETGGDIAVRGGILGQERAGKIRSGGSVTARFCEEADVRAVGDIRFTRESLNSVLHTDGKLLVAHGSIIGGSAYARGGVEAKVLGSAAGVPTDIAIGIHPKVLLRIRQLESEIKAAHKTAEQIRERVQPLMANMKRLTSQQREQATELLSKADEIEFSVSDKEGERKELLENSGPAEPPFVRVEKLVNAGVRIAIGMRETRFAEPLRGPLRIEIRKIEGASEIVAASKRTGSLTVLPNNEIDLKSLAAAAQANGENDGTDEDDHTNRRA